MKRPMLLTLLLVLASAMTGCGNGATPSPTGAPVVENQASLLAALQAAGATASVGDSVVQDFFTPEGKVIKLNGQDLQVFEYETSEAMEAEASQVAPDGGSVGTSIMMWMDAPHFYKTGRIIVLYIGSDQAILDVLDKVIGPQFAGQ